MNNQAVEAGCTKCNERFVLPVNEMGVPIWIHQCPKTTDERIDELTTLVKELSDKLDPGGADKNMSEITRG